MTPLAGARALMELAKVICEVSVLPPLVTPLLEVEASECATVADYAPPAVPPVESVLESPGYTVPEDLGCSWMPDFVTGSDGTNTDEGGFLQSLREPLPPLTGTPPTTPMVAAISPLLGVQNSGGRESTPVTLVSPTATDGVVTDETGRTYPEKDLSTRVTQITIRGSHRWCWTVCRGANTE